MRTDKTVIILRGISGAGKTFTAKTIKSLGPMRCVIVSADDYFIKKDGSYKFDPKKIGMAHTFCFNNFMSALDNPGIDVVIVANTNTQPWEFEKYLQAADRQNVPCCVLTVENWHGGGTNYAPEEARQRQLERLAQTIKLS